MKRYLFFSLLLLPLCVFSQIRIDISSNLVKDTTQMSYCYLNSERLNWQDFPVFITRGRNCIDTVIFVQNRNDCIVSDTILVIFPQKSKLLLDTDNDGSLDIIQKYPRKRYKIKAKFVVQNASADTIICCYSSETALTGQIFTESNISGWLKPFISPYQSNMIQVRIYNAKNLNYYVLEKKDALLFGDKNCSIVGWEGNQLHNLYKIVSYKLRLFKRKRIIIHFDNDTHHVYLSFSKIRQ